MGWIRDSFTFSIGDTDGDLETWRVLVTTGWKDALRAKPSARLRIWIGDVLAVDAVVPMNRQDEYEPVRRTLDIDGTLYGLELGYVSFKDHAIRLWRDGEVVYRSHDAEFNDGGEVGQRVARLNRSVVGDKGDDGINGEEDEADGWTNIVGVVAGLAVVFLFDGPLSTLIGFALAAALPAATKLVLKSLRKQRDP